MAELDLSFLPSTPETTAPAAGGVDLSFLDSAQPKDTLDTLGAMGKAAFTGTVVGLPLSTVKALQTFNKFLGLPPE